MGKLLWVVYFLFSSESITNLQLVKPYSGDDEVPNTLYYLVLNKLLHYKNYNQYKKIEQSTS